MDIEGQKLRDTFLWNKNESMLAPEQFAEVRTHFQGVGGGIYFQGGEQFQLHPATPLFIF